MTLKLTLPINGQPTEVELAPEVLQQAGLLPKAEVESQYVPLAKHNAEMAAMRTQSRGKKSAEEFLADDAFLDSLLEQRGDVLRERLGVKGQRPTADQLRELEARVTDQRVRPLTEKLTRLEQRAARAAIGEALRGEDYEVDPELAPLLQAYYGPRLKLDDETGEFFLADGKGGFEVTPFPAKDRAPYKTVGDDLREMRQAGKNLNWFTSKARNGVGYKGPGPTGVRTPTDLDQAIAAAESKGDFATAQSLKAKKLQALTNPSAA